MLEIKSFGSGSAGNCYIVTDSKTTIMLEAGLPIGQIKQALDYKVSQLDGVLLSHSHGDHAKSVLDVAKMGINIFLSNGTRKELGFMHHRLHVLNPRQPFTIGTFKILPFDVEHDTDEPFGYLLQSEFGGKLLFITDSYYCKYKFPGVTHMLLECNYAEDILQANIDSGKLHPRMKKRLMRSHFSLENVKKFLQANDLSQLEEIWLIHLSDGNSDEARFKKEIQELTGVPVVIA